MDCFRCNNWLCIWGIPLSPPNRVQRRLLQASARLEAKADESLHKNKVDDPEVDEVMVLCNLRVGRRLREEGNALLRKVCRRVLQ